MVSAEFSADGSKLLTASADQSVQLWDARAGRRLAEPLELSAPVKMAQFSPDGSKLLTAAARSVRVWGRPWLAAMPLHAGEGFFTRMACFSPDGRRLLVARPEHVLVARRLSGGRRRGSGVWGDGRQEVLVYGSKGTQIFANRRPLAIPTLYNNTLYNGM